MFLPTHPDSVAIGVDDSGFQAHLNLFSTDGGKVTLIGGNPGKGKSSLIKLLLAGMVESNYSIVWFDAKSGADARPFKERVEIVDDPSNPEIYLSKLLELQEIARDRNRFRGEELDISLLKRVVLFVDEWAVLAGMGSKNLQTQIQMELRKLAATSRSANMALVLATQRPTKDNIDVTTRELSNNRIAFAVGDIHASEAILGVSGAEPTVNPLTPGQAIMWQNGDLRKVVLYEVPGDLKIRCQNNKGMKVSVSDLTDENNIFAREYGIT